MHYKGTGKVHSFRGLLADGEQGRIGIQGSVGAIAWRITKFQLLSAATSATYEHIVKIFREEQSTVDGVLNFSDSELLAAGYGSQSDTLRGGYNQYIFDNALFVRDIFITAFEAEGSAAVNYYIELEEIKVSKAGMAQLAVAAARRVHPE